ncbi:2730_t:CDS:2, partial [Dentiscutata heterogama]
FAGCESAPGFVECESALEKRESAPGAKWHLRRYFCSFFSSFIERESAPRKVAPSGNFTGRKSAPGKCISFVGHKSALRKASLDMNQRWLRPTSTEVDFE